MLSRFFCSVTEQSLADWHVPSGSNAVAGGTDPRTRSVVSLCSLESEAQRTQSTRKSTRQELPPSEIFCAAGQELAPSEILSAAGEELAPSDIFCAAAPEEGAPSENRTVSEPVFGHILTSAQTLSSLRTNGSDADILDAASSIDPMGWSASIICSAAPRGGSLHTLVAVAGGQQVAWHSNVNRI